MAKTVLRTPTFSCSQAARYMRCMRRVKATPEYRSSKALKIVTLLVAPGGVVKSCSTAAAESPVSANRLMKASAIALSSPAGAALATMMKSGISAVNACEESTMERSKPSIRMKRMTLRPRNESIARWAKAVRSSERSAGNNFMPDTAGRRRYFEAGTWARVATQSSSAGQLDAHSCDTIS